MFPGAALWTNECHFAKILINRVKKCCIRVKFVAILSLLQKCNPSSVAITTKDVIVLLSLAQTDNLMNEIFLSDIQKAYFAHIALSIFHLILLI